MTNFVSKKLCWFMIGLLVFFWSGIVEAKAFAQAQKELTDQERQQMIEKLNRLFDALKDAVKEVPRDTFDPQAVVDNVGKDPIKLFEWVRDNTTLVSYRGVLRGPIGVLMDRLGNSLDRSLLLTALLNYSGHNCRLANATLTPNLVREIRDNALTVPASSKDIASKTSHPNGPEMKTRDHSDFSNEFQSELEKSFLESKRNAEDALQMSETLANLLVETVGEPVQAQNLIKREKTEAFNALRDHWWTQVEYEGAWVDLDPTFRDYSIGSKIVDEQRTFSAESLNKNLFHRVDIRILIERWERGRLREERLVEHRLMPSDFIGQPVIIYNFPTQWPLNSDFLNAKNPIQALSKELLAQEKWVPTIQVDSEEYTASAVDLSGKKVAEKKKKSPSASIGGLSSGLMGGGRKQNPEVESSWVAEWIEFDINVPGAKKRTIRREIFDLIGAKERALNKTSDFKIDNDKNLERGFGLLQVIYILPLGGHLSPEFVIHRTSEKMLEMRRPISKSFDSAKPDEIKSKSENVASQLLELAIPLYNLAMARQAWSHHDSSFYLDKLNVLNFRTGYRRTSLGEPRQWLSYDIVFNPVSFFTNETSPFKARLKQGVIDTLAEALLLNEYDFVKNTVGVFAEAMRQGTELSVIVPIKNRQMDESELEPSVRDLTTGRLSDEHIHVIPKKPVRWEGVDRIGWWRIDPYTGDTIGVMDTGLHQGSADWEVDAGVPYYSGNGDAASPQALTEDQLRRREVELRGSFRYKNMWSKLPGGKNLDKLLKLKDAQRAQAFQRGYELGRREAELKTALVMVGLVAASLWGMFAAFNYGFEKGSGRR